mmetsp:Transcript_21129/g.34201  ORF Transcript_21129/g.34201 Transcript_21129/m.34201 type:complete len:530 (+) Transcript_21129:45-1634(+)
MGNSASDNADGAQPTGNEVCMPDVSKEKKTLQAPPVSLADIEKNIELIGKAAEQGQTRLISRALRYNTPIRKGVTPEVLIEAIKKFIPESRPFKPTLIQLLESLPKTSEPVAMETEAAASAGAEKDKAADAAKAKEKAKPPARKAVPAALGERGEVEVYLAVLVLTTVLRAGRPAEAAELATALVDRVKELNRRTLDPLSAKAYFYFAEAYARLGKLGAARPALLALHRSCCLRHDEHGQAVLLNAALRSLLEAGLVEAADRLLGQAKMPPGAGAPQLCRHLYYTGAVRAAQLDYSDAAAALGQALRKAPQGPGQALGFRLAAQRLRALAQLLTGEVPDRRDFEQPPALRAPLRPYRQLAAAVRGGDLVKFQEVADRHAAVFEADRTALLVRRLAHNVVKIGLRKINLSYSKISLQDLAERLHLGDARTAEYVAAKAIRDGVLEAEIDPENGWLVGKEVADAYATDEPQRAFHQRVAFCLDVHNEAVKAMRYPPNAYKKELEDNTIEQDKTDEEIAKEIEEELDEEDGL